MVRGGGMTDVEKRRFWVPPAVVYLPLAFPSPAGLRRIRCPTTRITFAGLIGAVAFSVAIMIFTWVLRSAIFTLLASAASFDGGGVPSPGSDGKYTLCSEGIRANFIPYGGSISNLFINDTNGVERDIVLGFDNATYYSIDTSHPHLGGVPGRYANRIKNR
jgi:hypothetical protein